MQPSLQSPWQWLDFLTPLMFYQTLKKISQNTLYVAIRMPSPYGPRGHGDSPNKDRKCQLPNKQPCISSSVSYPEQTFCTLFHLFNLCCSCVPLLVPLIFVFEIEEIALNVLQTCAHVSTICSRHLFHFFFCTSTVQSYVRCTSCPTFDCSFLYKIYFIYYCVG